MGNSKENNHSGLGIPTIGFVEELDRYLESLNKEELSIKLEEFGFTEEAESLRLGETQESEMRTLLFICYENMRNEDRWKARHERKRAKKSK